MLRRLLWGAIEQTLKAIEPISIPLIPAVTNVFNELIREALYPYPNNLVIATKVGYGQGEE